VPSHPPRRPPSRLSRADELLRLGRKMAAALQNGIGISHLVHLDHGLTIQTEEPAGLTNAFVRRLPDFDRFPSQASMSYSLLQVAELR
jgi:hypothetical protein